MATLRKAKITLRRLQPKMKELTHRKHEQWDKLTVCAMPINGLNVSDSIAPVMSEITCPRCIKGGKLK